MKVLVTTQEHYSTHTYEVPFRYALEHSIIQVEGNHGAIEEIHEQVYNVKNFLVHLTEILYMKGLLSDEEVLKLCSTPLRKSISIRREE
jgi:hypothetical protein